MACYMLRMSCHKKGNRYQEAKLQRPAATSNTTYLIPSYLRVDTVFIYKNIPAFSHCLSLEPRALCHFKHYYLSQLHFAPLAKVKQPKKGRHGLLWAIVMDFAMCSLLAKPGVE